MAFITEWISYRVGIAIKRMEKQTWQGEGGTEEKEQENDLQESAAIREGNKLAQYKRNISV